MSSEGITGVPQFLAHAHAIETEAAARYGELADQMEVHNNPEVAAVFRKLERIEGLHAQQILDRAKGMELPAMSPLAYRWAGPESPEAVDAGEAHYLMTPWHALRMALKGEQQAVDFFSAIEDSTPDPEVRKMAAEYAEEEREHVRLIEEWLTKVPEPDAAWAEDPDPPVMQE